MLPAAHRIRCSSDFDRVVRTGARIGRRNLVLHLREDPGQAPARVGFVVSRAVGPAVKRNLVKRRLRSVVARELENLPPGTDVVVRALPAAGSADFSELESDVQSGISRYVSRARKGQAVK